MMRLLLLHSACLFISVNAFPCDSEAGQVCPTSSGKEVGECLSDPSKHVLTDIDGNPRELEPGEKPMELSADCKAFIKINAACDADIEEHCEGGFFGADTMTCLTQWKYDVLGDACKAELPKKEEKDEKKAAQAKKKVEKEANREIREYKAAVKKIPKDSKLKRPLTAYISWFNDNRDQIVAQVGKGGAEATKKGAEMWKTLPAQKKTPYEDKAQQAKKEYEEFMATAEAAALLKAYQDAVNAIKKPASMAE